jgi:hypothetical protein
VFHPVPVPISSTRIPGSARSTVNISATTLGMLVELV